MKTSKLEMNNAAKVSHKTLENQFDVRALQNSKKDLNKTSHLYPTQQSKFDASGPRKMEMEKLLSSAPKIQKWNPNNLNEHGIDASQLEKAQETLEKLNQLQDLHGADNVNDMLREMHGVDIDQMMQEMNSYADSVVPDSVHPLAWAVGAIAAGLFYEGVTSLYQAAKGALDGEYDLDGDGIPNKFDPDIDGDGIPNGEDDDDDNDGYKDVDDRYPSNPGEHITAESEWPMYLNLQQAQIFNMNNPQANIQRPW